MLNSLKYRISQIRLSDADIPYTWTDQSQERKRSDLEKWRDVHDMEFKECGDFRDHECLDVLKLQPEDMRVDIEVLEKLFEKTDVDMEKKVNMSLLNFLK